MKHRGGPAFFIRLLATGLLYSTGLPGLHAQNVAYTLRAYTDLVQVPTLVLSKQREQTPLLTRAQFAVSLDYGPLFQPTKMRIEGDDPISLAVLLDAGGSANDIVKYFGESLSKLAPQVLQPKDHVSIYAVDCSLVRSINDIPADATALNAGVAAALAAPGLHGTKRTGACGRSIHLWDAIAQLTKMLSDLPGRRVLLVVSNGRDGGSATGSAEVINYAGSKGVAIFALRDWDIPHFKDLAADPLDQVCESNGGVALLAQPRIGKSLELFIAMLRGRYILEFPRPNQNAPGRHFITVTVPGTQDFITTTGVTYPLPDPAVLADPLTIRPAPSPAKFGKTRPADHAQ
jgi:hypothetical protein